MSHVKKLPLLLIMITMMMIAIVREKQYLLSEFWAQVRLAKTIERLA